MMRKEISFSALIIKKAVIYMLMSLFILIASDSYAQINAEQASSKQASPKNVTLHYFWSRYCPHCLDAKPFINQLPKTYSWLTLKSYDLVGSKENKQLYLQMAEKLQQPANSVPGFIFCDQMIVGYGDAETTGKQLEEKLVACHSQNKTLEHEQTDQFNIPGYGQLHYQDYSLPVFTLLIASLDAFNPCAFFILFFLLSLIVHQKSRIRMLVIGCTFVLCSGLMYFMFMSAWLNLFLITEQLILITTIAGIIALVFGLINIKDYFFFKQGVSLSLSDSARTKIFARIRLLTQQGSWPTMIAATIILAVAANSYELLCTAGLPMVYTRVLTLNNLTEAQYYLYLAFYNVVYIIPLLIIVVLFTVTLGRKKISEQEGRILKLLSGSMMVGLGAILSLKPELLNNMAVSVGVVLGAVLITFVVVMCKKLKFKL